MIFLSHNYNDKPIVEQIAVKLANVFGEENVFYDGWSIQPGDGIINEMDKGLKNCKMFFFFISKKSLTSKMVELEWQSALYKATGGNCKFVPVRIEECDIPTILKSTLYIDLFTNGMDACVGQMVNVIQGASTFTPLHSGYTNLRFKFIETEQTKVVFDIMAMNYLEPIPHFLILVENEKSTTQVKLPHEGPFRSGFNENVSLNNGQTFNAWFIATMGRGITPSMPLRVSLEGINGEGVVFKGVMHQKAQNKYEIIPRMD